MKVDVYCTSYSLIGTNNKMNLRIKSDVPLTAENKTNLVQKICKLIENEIENDELLKQSNED